MARPTKLDDLTAKRILDSVSAGNSLAVAAQSAGIAPSTLHTWTARGRRGEPGYLEFHDRLKRARCVAETFYVGVIKQAAEKGTWQAAAWWLERTRPKRYGLRKAEGAPLAPAEHITPEQARELLADQAVNDAELLAQIDAKRAARGSTPGGET